MDAVTYRDATSYDARGASSGLLHVRPHRLPLRQTPAQRQSFRLLRSALYSMVFV